MKENEEYFDFETVDEYPEELDYQNLKPCPHCKKPIPSNATMCLYCGEPVEQHHPESKGWIKWIGIFTAIAFLLLIILQ